MSTGECKSWQHDNIININVFTNGTYLKFRKREDITVGVVSNEHCDPWVNAGFHGKHYWFSLNLDDLGKLMEPQSCNWKNPGHGKDINNGDIVCM